MNNLAAAYGHLIQAVIHLEAEIAASGETYALADALSLVQDALSQCRGEQAARLPEHPIYIRGAA